MRYALFPIDRASYEDIKARFQKLNRDCDGNYACFLPLDHNGEWIKDGPIIFGEYAVIPDENVFNGGYYANQKPPSNRPGENRGHQPQ